MKGNETLVSALERSVDRHGPAPIFGERQGDRWTWVTYRAFGRQVDAARAGLAAAGIVAGDRVALLSNNRVAWAVAAYACYGLGAAVVPMYPAQGVREWEHILRDSGARLLVCATRSLYERCAPLVEAVESLEMRLCFELSPSDPGSFVRLTNEGRERPLPARDPDPDAVATILYTSGTGGPSKGVMLSHRNITSNVAALLRALPLSHRDRSLSFLPWAHAFGQTCELHAMVRLGASMALSASIERLGEELAEVQPTVLVSVPVIFTRIYERVQREMATRPRVIRELFERGIRLGQKRREGRLSVGDKIALELADRAVLSVIRARLGGRLRHAFTGGAPIFPEVADFMDDLGVALYQGYGLTEASPVVSIERPGARRRGSVGKPLDGVVVRCEGTEEHPAEILVEGPSVMVGYHDRPAETAAMLSEGVLRTGDLGYLDADGFLYLRGRLDEQYKLASGKDVAPAALEERIKLSAYIKNAMVYGEGRDHNVALAVVDLDALARWADARDLRFASTADMLASARVRAHLLAEIGERTRDVRHYERIRDVVLVAEDFTTRNGMLTATGKVRRHAVVEHHGERLSALYAGAA